MWLTTRLAHEPRGRWATLKTPGWTSSARTSAKPSLPNSAPRKPWRRKKKPSPRGPQPAAKELNGYPVETLNDPEVLALKNGYQNALSHYLAGFM